MKHIHHFCDLTHIILKHRDTWVYIPVQYHIDFTVEDFTSDVNEPGAFTTPVKYSSSYLLQAKQNSLDKICEFYSDFFILLCTVM